MRILLILTAVTTLAIFEPSHVSAQQQSIAPNPLTKKTIRFNQFRVGNRNVKSLLVDGDSLWVGTSGGVIHYVPDEDEYKLYDNRSGLLANGVFHLSKLNGKLAVGTYGGGLALMSNDAKSWDFYNIPEGMGDAFAYDMIQTSSGDIWIATWSGANRVRDGQLDSPDMWDLFTVESTAGGLPNDWVYSIREGVDGTIWLATEGGLARFQDNEWHNWSHEDGLGAPYEMVKEQIEFKEDPANTSNHHARQKIEQGLSDVGVAFNPNYVVALLVDHEGIVWCGTWGGGLARFDGSNWRNYTVNDGLPANHVFSLFQDSNNVMWAGTSQGISRFEGAGFTTFNVSDGLISNSVFAMAESHDGSTWVGSFGGVTRFLDPLNK